MLVTSHALDAKWLYKQAHCIFVSVVGTILLEVELPVPFGPQLIVQFAQLLKEADVWFDLSGLAEKH